MYQPITVFLSACLGMLSILPTPSHGEPLTLDQSIQTALANNPDSALAHQRINAAEAKLEQVNAAFFPQLQLQSTYMRTNNPINVFGAALNQKSFSPNLDFNNVPTADNLNMKGMLSLSLYNGGQNVANHEAAKAFSTATRKEDEAVKNALSLGVTLAFFNILKAREFIKASEAAVHSFENNLAIAKRRLAEGTILQADVLDVEVRLAQAKEDLIKSRNASDLSRQALKNILGIEEANIEISDTWPIIEKPIDDSSFTRPEIEAAKNMEKAAKEKVKAAKGGYLPKISAFTSVDYNRGWKFDGDGTSYTGGVLAQWVIFDGFLTASRTSEAQAELNGAVQQERKLRLAIELEKEQASLNAKEAQERIGVTSKAIEQAKESVELTRARFDQGLALTTQLIDAEASLVGAKVRNAEAKADAGIALAAYRKALGLPILSGGGISK